MAIILVRHAETALNAARTIQPFDTPISSRGIEQAARLARRLSSSFHPARILSSDAPRALQSAAPLAEALGRPVLAEPLLRERDFGALRGQAYDQLGFDPLQMREAPPGGESMDAFEARVRQAWLTLNQAQLEAPTGDLIVFSHGLWIRSALRHALPGLEPSLCRMVLENTSVTVIDRGPPPELVLAACTAHLDDALQARGIAGI
jgi:probable phosphoglycerate mutase